MNDCPRIDVLIKKGWDGMGKNKNAYSRRYGTVDITSRTVQAWQSDESEFVEDHCRLLLSSQASQPAAKERVVCSSVRPKV
jgi:hypothetical protein